MTRTESITIRRAGDRDAEALARLAVIDSSAELRGEVLLAEEGAELRAAVSLADGAVIADPFHRTLSLVELLRLRAGRLGDRPVELGRTRPLRRARRAFAHPR